MQVNDFECARVWRDLEKFLKYDLDENRARALREHLNVCDGCGLDYHKVGKRLLEVVLLTCQDKAPKDLLETVRKILWNKDSRV